MGGGSWNSQAWTGYAQAHVHNQPQAAVFTQQAKRTINEDVDPTKFKNGIRESVDGPDNPESTPVGIFTDMTGSMGMLAREITEKLDVVNGELLDRKPVKDVHMMTGVIGDGYTDKFPFQATQFEADLRIVDQTRKLYLEGGGGGNGGESYALAWLFAAMQTATDSYDKRKKKGYLFTAGDEPVHGVEESGRGEKYGVTKEQAKRILGLDIERDLTANECLAMAQRKWNVFHIALTQNGYSGYRSGIEATFGKIMPNQLLWLEDLDALSETIVSVIEVNEGRDKGKVAQSWGGDKSLVVANALRDMVVAGAAGDQGVVRL
jgi:hypothetical protein